MAEKKSTTKKTTRVWKTYVVERRSLDNRLTELSAQGFEVFALYPAINVAGAFDVITYRDE